jgi:hemerythrin-like domain-containing protein
MIMPFRLVSEQMVQEHEVLARLSDALRTAIRWGQHSDLARKLIAVHFLAEAFQRHLKRMLEVEERGGYLEMIEGGHPEFRTRAKVFREEHDQFRSAMRDLLPRMNCDVSPTTADAESVFNSLSMLLEMVDDHNKQELDLLRDVILNQGTATADPRD